MARPWTCTLPFLLALQIFSSGRADTVLVRPDGGGDFPTIQAALDAVRDGDVVELADGIFRGDGNRDLDYLGKAVTVRSAGGNPELCILDVQAGARDLHRGVFFAAGEGPGSVLAGVTIRNGGNDYGGAVRCQSASPTLIDCRLTNCWAMLGGGLYCDPASAPTCIDCTFASNTAPKFGGGACCCNDVGVATFIRCTFTANSANHGGGLYCTGGPTLLEQCLLEGNVASGFGGGIVYLGGGPHELRNCRFEGNTATHGGALDSSGSDLLVEDCTFSANQADNGGVMMSAHGDRSRFSGCVMDGNTAADRGGVIVVDSGSRPLFASCTLAGNQAARGAGIYHDSEDPASLERTIIAFGEGSAVHCVSGAPVLSCCDLYGNTGGDWTGAIAGQVDERGNFSANPCFCGGRTGDFTLCADSWCLPGLHPWGCDDLVGALGAGCLACDCLGPIPIETLTWGAVKAGYR